MNGAIATKRKAYISIDLKTSNVTIGFDLGHDPNCLNFLSQARVKSTAQHKLLAFKLETNTCTQLTQENVNE